MENKLREDEEFIFQSRSHLIKLISSIPLIALGFVNPIFFYIGGGVFIFYAAGYYSLQYVITNQRIIVKRGFFYIRIEEIPLTSIDDLKVYQNLSDRIFGSGTVMVFGKGISTAKFRMLDKPKRFRNAAYSQLPAKV